VVVIMTAYRQVKLAVRLAHWRQSRKCFAIDNLGEQVRPRLLMRLDYQVLALVIIVPVLLPMTSTRRARSTTRVSDIAGVLLTHLTG
jgi:hypothetical protein